VHLFQAHHAAFGSPSDLVAQSWDLPALAGRYEDFIAATRPVAARWRRRDGDPASAFAEHVRVLARWRPLPFLDPGLPAETLPARWPGATAWTLFHDLTDRLADPALEHVEEVVGAPAQRAPARLVA
jgi:phenylacetic acid degradation operon negative regulatory protein